MTLANVKIGVAFTGSFCTYDKIFKALEQLVSEGASVTTIFSFNSQTISSRFGTPEEFLEKAEEITGNKPITTIGGAEPIGPKGLFDLVLIAPCTGNTLAKFSHGITDTPALMAAKSHLRNNRPVVISISTNDALSMNLKNIGALMNLKNIYFVPFGQDNYKMKPNSMVAHEDLILPAVMEALDGRQVQPIIMSPN